MSSTAARPTPITTQSENISDRVADVEWLTAAEAAKYSGGVGLSTIREACNRNALRHVRIGGGVAGPIRTRKEWITEWLRRWARGGEDE